MGAADHPLGPLAGLTNILNSPSLAGMRTLRQWIVYLLAPDSKKPGKMTKIPVHHATGMPCSVVEQANWTDVATAAASAQAWGPSYGVGFCFVEGGPYWFIDLDSCRQADGSWSPLAQRIFTVLHGAAVEVSASGSGLHFFGRGAVPPHSSKNIEHHAECYTGGRFCAMTGTALQGSCDIDLTAQMTWVVQTYFPPRQTAAVSAAQDDAPAPEWRGPTDDADLLRRALQSRSGAATFGGKATFADLWHGDVGALSRSYPADPASSEPYDRSSADAALAQLLAFWTGRDVARIERLMRQSKLYREKWDRREDYLVERTIRGACARQVQVLQDKAVEPVGHAVPAPAAAAPAASPAPLAPVAAPTPATAGSVAAKTTMPTARQVEGNTFLTPAQQIEHFKGCVYIQDEHRVLVPGSGKTLKPDQFKAWSGGYTYIMDNRNERTTRNAFEAFTESQAVRFPRADGVCFKPLEPPGAVIETAGRTYANTWWPANTPKEPGDVEPFLQHLRLLFPDENDRQQVLYYLANMVQHAGHKFQWAPVLIGTPGNGKSLLSRCIAHALGRHFVHWPKAEKLDGKFNAWMSNKLAYLVEDVFIGGKVEVLESLKPLITGEFLELERKGIDQEAADVCGNWLFNANRRDAIRKTDSERRYMVTWCAQQSREDLNRDGMTEDYFAGLYGWANHEGGYAKVSHYLQTLPIPPEFGLRWVMGRAPRTSSTDRAIEATRSPVEIAILEAIEQGQPGFRGGWVSSIMLGHLVDRHRLRNAVSRAEWGSIMEALGYVLHPALASTKGQAHNDVLPDGGKPKLYVQKDDAAAALHRAADVAKAYQQAQGMALR